MKWLIGLLMLVLVIMQHQIWFGQSGFFARQALAAQYERQRQRVDDLNKRNQKMTAEVLALKQHPDAFESRARSDLGLVKPGEFFYLIPDEEP